MNNNNKESINKKVLIATLGTVAVSLIVILFFGLSTIKEDKQVKEADSLIEMKRFEEGIAIYDNILKKYFSNNEYIAAKRDLAIELMESDENYQEEIEEIEVVTEEPIENPSDIEEDTIAEVEDLIKNGNLDKAKMLVDTYLKESPNSIKMKKLKDTIVDKQTEIERQAEEERRDAEIAAKAEEDRKNEEIAAKAEKDRRDTEAREAKAEEDRKNAEAKAEEDRKNEEAKAEQDRKNEEAKAEQDRKNEEAKAEQDRKNEDSSNDIIGSNRTITSSKANLRESPTLDSTILNVLKKGTKVYISDTKVESKNRIWCLVKVEGSSKQGWISYNTMNSTIQ